MPDKAMAQIIFEPVVKATLEETHALKETKRGTRGFGSTDAHTFNASVKTLEKYQERPPGTHYLGSKAAKVFAKLGSPNGDPVEVIVDSGSNISLIAQKTLNSMAKPPSSKCYRISSFPPFTTIIPILRQLCQPREKPQQALKQLCARAKGRLAYSYHSPILQHLCKPR